MHYPLTEVLSTLTPEQAAAYRRRINNRAKMAVAIQVRNEHCNGGRCIECPPPDSTSRACPRWTAWLPIFIELDRERPL